MGTTNEPIRRTPFYQSSRAMMGHVITRIVQELRFRNVADHCLVVETGEGVTQFCLWASDPQIFDLMRTVAGVFQLTSSTERVVLSCQEDKE